MPARLRSRQPALDWFAGTAGQGLLAAEEAARLRVLGVGPPLPWVWIGVSGTTPPPVQRRGIVLRRAPFGLDGTVRCAVPLPLPSEGFGTVLIQHALDDDAPADGLLAECERVLVPGGTLWLAALNPWSVYRAHWARTGLHARGAAYWQGALRRAGFASETVNLQWLGARWRAAHGEAGIGAGDRLRAGVALTVSKRAYAGIPALPVRRMRWQTSPGTRSPLARR